MKGAEIGARVEGQKSRGQRDLESKSEILRPAESRPERKDK